MGRGVARAVARPGPFTWGGRALARERPPAPAAPGRLRLRPREFGRSAAACLGLLPYASATIHLVTERKLSRRPPLHPHRARSLDARDITSVQGIPTTTIPRTALDLAAKEPERVERLLAQADRMQLYDLGALHATIARNPGHHGVGALATLIAAVPVLTRSELEAIQVWCAARARTRGRGIEKVR